MTKAGILYCKAFPKNYLPNSFSEVKAGGFLTYIETNIEAQSATVTIKNLDPDTTYDIQCGTEDYQNRVMELADVRLSMQRVKTLCCRQIKLISFTDKQSVLPSEWPAPNP